MKIDYRTCLTCARSLPTNADFAGPAKICSDCALLDRETLVLMSIDKFNREHSAQLGAVALRKIDKQAAYLITGKRCVHGHHYKPVSDYDKCASRADGLQPACRACNKLRVTLLNSKGALDTSGAGLKLWQEVRDSMRLIAAKEQANPTIPAPIHYSIDAYNVITQVPKA